MAEATQERVVPATKAKSKPEGESSEIRELRNQVQALTEQFANAQLRLQSLTGAMQSPAEIERFASKVAERLRLTRMLGGKHHWQIINSRYKLPNGEYPAHDFWSDAETPRDAVADYKKRCGIQWDVSEGADPYQAALVEKNARPADIKKMIASV